MYILCFYLAVFLTIPPGLKLKFPYLETSPLADRNCASKALGLSSARMLILERILLKRQMRDIALANRSLQHVCPLAREWCFTWKAVSMIWRILDESSCSKPTSAMGKYSLSFYKQMHIINSKSQTKQYNFNKSTITTCTNLVVCVWVVSHGKDGNDVVCGKYTDQCWYRGVILTCIHCVIVIDT